jgi:hypothetical protein
MRTELLYKQVPERKASKNQQRSFPEQIDPLVKRVKKTA